MIAILILVYRQDPPHDNTVTRYERTKGMFNTKLGICEDLLDMDNCLMLAKEVGHLEDSFKALRLNALHLSEVSSKDMSDSVHRHEDKMENALFNIRKKPVPNMAAEPVAKPNVLPTCIIFQCYKKGKNGKLLRRISEKVM